MFSTAAVPIYIVGYFIHPSVWLYGSVYKTNCSWRQIWGWGVSHHLPRAIFPHLISRWKGRRVRGTVGISGPEEAGLKLQPGCSAPQERLSTCFLSVTMQSAMADYLNYASKYEHLDSRGLPKWLSGKEPTCQSRSCGFDPWVRKIPWRRKWQPTQYSCLGNPVAEEPGGPQSMGLQKSWTQLSDLTMRRR